jgi:hypothetical protein
MKKSLQNILEKIQIIGAKGRSVSLLTVFNEIVTDTIQHENPKEPVEFFYDELVERFTEDAIHSATIDWIYFDCLYLFCNACMLGIIKESEVEVKFKELCNREAFNAVANDEDELWELVVIQFYKAVSYS